MVWRNSFMKTGGSGNCIATNHLTHHKILWPFYPQRAAGRFPVKSLAMGICHAVESPPHGTHAPSRG